MKGIRPRVIGDGFSGGVDVGGGSSDTHGSGCKGHGAGGGICYEEGYLD